MNLKEELEKATRQEARKFRFERDIVKSRPLQRELIQLCFDDDQEMSVKACWLFESVYLHRVRIFPYIFPTLVENVHRLKHDSAKRPMLRVLYNFLERTRFPIAFGYPFRSIITPEKKEKIIEVCFDWLIGNEKVAIKAYAMRILELIGKDSDWVYPELTLILQENMEKHSAAYKAAAKDVLKKMRR
ncbi:hypothetical protein SAMN05216480_102200 [Pustulibacterium marinum]|uniref:Adenylosuccinate lyase n=1 Tax=Pustulibacterium marinum TaxID=1224947 RepID=A0A1I7FSX7_9FLAO|nr:hypothetical protein [Pustulibacterium marinum]SFU39257.1 hypothetical protein SAMN05216480_102200 [Pustulibacterium marinum]